MIKCIASDMDGTLINSQHVISQENANAIRAAKEHGVEVVIATGRSYEEAKYLLEEAGIECPIICVNGAEIRSAEGEKLASTSLTASQVQQIIKVLKEHDIYFEVYTSDGTYSTDYDKAISTIMDIFMSANSQFNSEQIVKKAKERFEKGRVHLIESYESLWNKPDVSFYKILAFTLDEHKLAGARKTLTELQGVAVSSSGKENIEITHEEAQKGIALEKFVIERGIGLHETMAIGDNYNDLSMFKIVGRAVAMGNAPDEIKKYCHVVTDTNDQNGVAKAILEVLEK
jgi:Cof subfamily protein (haloacid dehalogenase superfamily)